MSGRSNAIYIATPPKLAAWYARSVSTKSTPLCNCQPIRIALGVSDPCCVLKRDLHDDVPHIGRVKRPSEAPQGPCDDPLEELAKLANPGPTAPTPRLSKFVDTDQATYACAPIVRLDTDSSP